MGSIETSHRGAFCPIQLFDWHFFNMAEKSLVSDQVCRLVSNNR